MKPSLWYRILSGSFLLSLVGLLGFYISFHPLYPSLLMGGAANSGLVLALVGFGFTYLWWHLRPVSLLNIGGYLLGLWSLLALVVVLFLSPASFLGEANVMAFLFRSIFHLVLALLGILITGLWFAGIGSKILQKQRKKSDHTAFWVASFWLGFWLVALMGFILARGGIFSPMIWTGLFSGESGLVMALLKILLAILCLLEMGFTRRFSFGGSACRELLGTQSFTGKFTLFIRMGCF